MDLREFREKLVALSDQHSEALVLAFAKYGKELDALLDEAARVGLDPEAIALITSDETSRAQMILVKSVNALS